MDNKTKDAIKQLQAEYKQLQADIRQLHALIIDKAPIVSDSRPAAIEEKAAGRKEKGDAAVQIWVQPLGAEGRPEKTPALGFTLSQLAAVEDGAAASLAYALSSPHKVALLRSLAQVESQKSSELGRIANLSTGSLYHHLRELMRADMIQQTARNHYVITDRGARALYVLQALAAA
jgi:DNA gyrase subunit B